MPILGILNPFGAKAAFEGRNVLALHSTQYTDIDPGKRNPILQKSPAYIPIQASYDTHYIYVSSQTGVFGKYTVVDGNEEKAMEGEFSTTSGIEQKINISSLPEGDYTLQVTIGEQTLEGDFHVGK